MCTIFYFLTNILQRFDFITVFIITYSTKHLDKSGLVLADVLAVGAFDVVLIDHGVLHGGIDLGVAE